LVSRARHLFGLAFAPTLPAMAWMTVFAAVLSGNRRCGSALCVVRMNRRAAYLRVGAARGGRQSRRVVIRQQGDNAECLVSSSGGHRVVAVSLRALYFSRVGASHQAWNASFDRCLAVWRRYASVGRAPAGQASRLPAFAKASASSLPGIPVWPGTQRTVVALCASASA
jgi:hypothetical protein